MYMYHPYRARSRDRLACRLLRRCLPACMPAALPPHRAPLHCGLAFAHPHREATLGCSRSQRTAGSADECARLWQQAACARGQAGRALVSVRSRSIQVEVQFVDCLEVGHVKIGGVQAAVCLYVGVETCHLLFECASSCCGIAFSPTDAKSCARRIEKRYDFQHECPEGERPPFPSSLCYDSKGWLCAMERARKVRGVVLFWNVGR
jgi:hypothetical protein